MRKTVDDEVATTDICELARPGGCRDGGVVLVSAKTGKEQASRSSSCVMAWSESAAYDDARPSND